MDKQNSEPKKRWIYLLIIALTVSAFSPVLGLFFPFPFLPLMIAGIITGGMALFKLRKTIGRVGLAISVVAIIWSFAWLFFYFRILWLMSRGLFP